MQANTSTHYSTCRFTGFFLISFLMALPASAQFVQVPNLSEFGNSNNAIPFSAVPMRYQQIYSASAFPHGGIIDKIMFRQDEEFFSLTYGPTDFDVQVALGYAATTVNTASATFANNIGDDFTIVLDGIITESYDGSPPATSFDFVLDVANSFTYDPTQGDLLMQVLVRNFNRPVAFDASLSPQQDVTTRIWAQGVNDATGTVGSQFGEPFGLVTQFQFVPEPSAIALLGVAGIFATQLRRKRTR